MSHLDTLTPLLGIIAAERTKERPDLFDEIRQEALIAAWRVEKAHPEASREYVLASARNAANGVLRGRPAFGAEGHQGRQDAHDNATSLTYDDDTDVDTVAALADPTAERALEAVEISDVAADVRAAVRDLPADEAEVVFLRFWQEMTWPEVAASMGRGTNATRVRFEKHIAATLRDTLAA